MEKRTASGTGLALALLSAATFGTVTGPAFSPDGPRLSSRPSGPFRTRRRPRR